MTQMHVGCYGRIKIHGDREDCSRNQDIFSITRVTNMKLFKFLEGYFLKLQICYWQPKKKYT